MGSNPATPTKKSLTVMWVIFFCLMNSAVYILVIFAAVLNCRITLGQIHRRLENVVEQICTCENE